MKFEKILAEALAAFEALSTEEQKAHREAQRESWVRGEKGMGLDKDERNFRDALPMGEGKERWE